MDARHSFSRACRFFSHARHFFSHARHFFSHTRHFFSHARHFFSRARRFFSHARHFFSRARRFFSHARRFFSHARRFFSRARHFFSRARRSGKVAGAKRLPPQVSLLATHRRWRWLSSPAQPGAGRLEKGARVKFPVADLERVNQVDGKFTPAPLSAAGRRGPGAAGAAARDPRLRPASPSRRSPAG